MIEGTVKVVSVRDLVRRRRRDDPDIWHLALVQRGEVWDHVRMRYLLDSLLTGYPIGALLVCRVKTRSSVIDVSDDQRSIRDAEADAWQLLDGQQRINAVYSMFTPEGGYGRFYLHMTARRPESHGPVTGRRARDTSLRYILWQQENEAEKAIAERDRHIDLSRWYKWAETDGGQHVEAARRDLAASDGNVVQILNVIDPDFADSLDDAGVEIAADRLRRLLEVWTTPSIAVQHLTLDSPLDVLEVFTRINRAGVLVAGEDLFFAAVKTLWANAEPTIARVVSRLGPIDAGAGVDPLVKRLGALRILARLAARGMGQADLVPLSVDRLSGPTGQLVIDGITTLSAEDSQPLCRMVVALQAIARASRLKFGLYSVDGRLWDDVLAWAAVNERCASADWVERQLPALDSYLLGATSFRYPSILRDQFARAALNEAVTAGVSGEAFPTRQIAEVTRPFVENYRAGRTVVPGFATEDARVSLADANASLFLSIVQAIPYRSQLGAFDWDHIFPQAKASLMWERGEAGRRRHHKYRRFVSSAGNLWGLDAGANRAAQEGFPSQKFEMLTWWPEKGQPAVWPRERWGLANEEIEEFQQVGEQLAAQTHINAAMTRFRDLVRGRALRITNEVFSLFPDAAWYAGDHDTAAAEPSAEPKIATALGIESPRDLPTQVSRPVGAFDTRLESVLKMADGYHCETLRQFVSQAQRVGLQARGYTETITITPPKTKAIALMALTPNAKQRGFVSKWVWPWKFAPIFPGISLSAVEAALGGSDEALLDSQGLGALGARLEELIRNWSAERHAQPVALTDSA